MSIDQQIEYYRRREGDARRLAKHAADASIRSIHLEMAKRYAKMADDYRMAQPVAET
jgi:hypothetical protein